MIRRRFIAWTALLGFALQMTLAIGLQTRLEATALQSGWLASHGLLCAGPQDDRPDGTAAVDHCALCIAPEAVGGPLPNGPWLALLRAEAKFDRPLPTQNQVSASTIPTPPARAPPARA